MLSSSVEFIVGAVVSLSTAWLLVTRIERISRRLGVSEAMLGLLAAFAANAPEITSSVTALIGHDEQISAGVILGSNVFNLAALLGIGALVAGRIALHRRVVAFTGTIAVWSGAVCLATVLGAIPAAVGLVLVVIVLVPYVALTATHGHVPSFVPCTAPLRRWLMTALHQEDREVLEAIDAPPARTVDVFVAGAALVVVVVASVAMERAGASLGARLAIPDIVVGGIVLAAVTSLPNAVAGVYLARRGRGAATFSTAFNSNALNLSIGYLLPAAIVGVATVSSHVTLVAVWYLVMAAALAAVAHSAFGIRRGIGSAIVAAYLAFVVVLVVTA